MIKFLGTQPAFSMALCHWEGDIGAGNILHTQDSTPGIQMTYQGNDGN